MMYGYGTTIDKQVLQNIIKQKDLKHSQLPKSLYSGHN